MKSVNFENDCVVLRSPATDPDLRAFARLWPDDVSLSKFLIRVTEAKGLDPKERDRLVRVIEREDRARLAARSLGVR